MEEHFAGGMMAVCGMREASGIMRMITSIVSDGMGMVTSIISDVDTLSGAFRQFLILSYSNSSSL